MPIPAGPLPTPSTPRPVSGTANPNDQGHTT